MAKYELATSLHFCYDRSCRIPITHEIERLAFCGFKNLDFNFLDMVDYPNRFLDEDYKDWMFECREFAESHGAKWVQARTSCGNRSTR